MTSGTLAALALLAALVVQPASQASAPLAVRFHHVHYQVEDPSAAMNEAAQKLGGRREVVSGVGVGLRLGDAFLVYDREPDDRDVEVRRGPHPAVADGYQAALAWLKSKGVVIEGDRLTSDMIQQAAASRYSHIGFAAVAFDEVVARLGTSLKRTADTALFDAGMVLVEVVRDTNVPDAFWCPMHPDVRSGRTGACPQCGMDLVPIPPPRVGEYRMDVAVQRSSGGANGVRLTIRDPETKEVVTNFETVHEKTFHLFIVSRDLEYFAHVHPLAQKDGSFLLKHPLPPGEYMLIADFLPVGGTSQMLQRAIVIGVRARFSKSDVLENRALTPRETVVDGVRVGLKVEDMVAGKDACLTFTLTDAQTGMPITDLQPFLGAPAHMLMVRGGLEDAVHAHPEELQTGGPTVSFHPLIPAGGPYKLWLQFRRGGRESTASFVVQAGAQRP